MTLLFFAALFIFAAPPCVASDFQWKKEMAMRHLAYAYPAERWCSKDDEGCIIRKLPTEAWESLWNAAAKYMAQTFTVEELQKFSTLSVIDTRLQSVLPIRIAAFNHELARAIGADVPALPKRQYTKEQKEMAQRLVAIIAPNGLDNDLDLFLEREILAGGFSETDKEEFKEFSNKINFDSYSKNLTAAIAEALPADQLKLQLTYYFGEGGSALFHKNALLETKIAKALLRKLIVYDLMDPPYNHFKSKAYNRSQKARIKMEDGSIF